MLIEITAAGSGVSIQDGGRMGWRRFGVPPGGAMDQASMRLANQLLGNRPQASVLEILLQGTRLRVLRDTWLSIAGANVCPQLRTGTARLVRKGEILEMSQAGNGIYAYLAVPGGFITDHWLGSASTDLRNGMGRTLGKNDRLDSGLPEPALSLDRVARRIASEPISMPSNTTQFELLPGPQFEQFSERARRLFIEQDWCISTRSDRTGYRLEGSALEIPSSIASEPVLPGSFQVPGNGLPIITMPDGPTVGGYAKIAVLKADDLDQLAQCAPGTKLSFTWAH